MLKQSTRMVARGVVAVMIGVVVAVGIGEGVMRIIYRDAGTRTLGGPGGLSFDHDTVDGVRRGRLAVGPKTPDIPRVMVIGDSITYGQGVHDWRQTWAERAASALERAGNRHEFAVLAVPGNDMPQHLDMMRQWVSEVQPDIVVYQWYVNDIEAISHRPDFTQPWQRWSWHPWLRSASYLYFVLDHRAATVVTRSKPTYADYLLQEFQPGSIEWAEFERQFHEFASLAMSAGRRIILLYPQVPFRGPYPLQSLHDRMRALAGPHVIAVPPASWIRSGGRLVTMADARWKQAVQLSDGAASSVLTADYAFAPGPLELRLQLAGASASPLAVVELVDVADQAVVASAPVEGGPHDALREATVRLTVPGPNLRRLAIRLTSLGDQSWALANIEMDANYGFEVIDLTEPLNQIQTHTSSFDAHPNEEAHAIIADLVYAALEKRP